MTLPAAWVIMEKSSRHGGTGHQGLITEAMKGIVLSPPSGADPQEIPSSGTIYQMRSKEAITSSYALWDPSVMEREDPAELIGSKVIRLERLLVKGMRLLTIALFFIGKAAFIGVLVLSLLQKKRPEARTAGIRAAILSAGLFLTALLLVAEVAWFCTFMGPGSIENRFFYGGHSSLFITAADMIAIGTLFTLLFRKTQAERKELS